MAEASYTIGDHRRPLSERLGAAVKLAGHVVLTAAGGPVFKLAGKAVGFGVSRLARTAVGRLVVSGAGRMARTGVGQAVGRWAAKGWSAANKPLGRLLGGGADDAARVLNLSDDVGRVANKADDATEVIARASDGVADGLQPSAGIARVRGCVGKEGSAVSRRYAPRRPL